MVHYFTWTAPFIFESAAAKTDEIRQEIGSIESIARGVRPLSPGEIPTEPGICLQGAFINLEPKYENMSIGVRMAELPDMSLSIELLKNRGYVYENLDLDIRLNESAEDARLQGHADWYARIKLLRRGPRKIGDWDGKEALAHKPPQTGNGEGHQFIFQAVGDKIDPMLPQAKSKCPLAWTATKSAASRPASATPKRWRCGTS